MFDDDFFDDLPGDPQIAGKRLCDSFKDFHSNLPSEQEEAFYEEYLMAFAALQALSEILEFKLIWPVFAGDITENIKEIVKTFSELQVIFDHEFTLSALEKYRASFGRKFGRSFLYNFTDGDLQRIQVLINEIREILKDTSALEDAHKARLFKRLEKLQAELHKNVSDLDRFWGLLIDGSIVLKKVGENAKPIVDRIQEISNIVWRVQTRAEQLPSNLPLQLPSGDNEP